MSQENDANQVEIWSWYTDAHGHVSSVSSGFTTSLGVHAGKQIIGNFFWTFAEGLEKPSNGWLNLENSFKLHKKIRKFIFHYNVQGQKTKIAISGEPVYEKDKYIGHRGTGYIADHNEISIPEIAQNMVELSLDSLDLGIAVLSPEMGLIEFNHHFMTHMTNAQVKVTRNMTFESIMSYLKARNNYCEALSYEIVTHSCFYFERSDKSFVCVKKTTLPNNIIMIKTEIDRNLFHSINNYKKNIIQLKNNNNILELRIRDYKDKLAHFFDKHPSSLVQDTDLKKFLEFYENNLDVGILITNIQGDIESTNYYTAQIFGYTTVSMLLLSDDNSEFKNYLIERQKVITDLSDNALNRFEHNLNLNNFMYQGDIKQVIIFYPSVHNPQKVVSLLYPQVKDVASSDYINNEEDYDNPNHRMYQEFVRYMVDDIKSSVNVINGYNELRNINKDTHKVEEYNEQINQSCRHILSSISDVMQVYKIASNMFNIEPSIISSEELIFDCLQQFNASILAKNIDLSFDVKNMGLFIISDKDLLYHALTRIFDCIIRSSSESSTLKIKLIDDIENQKINIIIADESSLNITNIAQANVAQIFNNNVIRSTGVLNLKIAENYLHLLGCKITVKSYDGLGNTLNIEISGDMVTNQHQRDRNNFVV